VTTARSTADEFHNHSTDVRDLARNQVLMREVNEHIRGYPPRHNLNGKLEIACECKTGDCDTRLTVSIDDYETVRAAPTRFLVCLAHADDGRVVAKTARFAVVEQCGEGAEVASRLDPRQRDKRS
jgi:hypothetical protein